MLAPTGGTHAQQSTVIVKLSKLVVWLVQCKDRIKLHLPTGFPVADLLTKNLVSVSREFSTTAAATGPNPEPRIRHSSFMA